MKLCSCFLYLFSNTRNFVYKITFEEYQVTQNLEMPDLELITTLFLERFQCISQWVFNDFIFFKLEKFSWKHLGFHLLEHLPQNYSSSSLWHTFVFLRIIRLILQSVSHRFSFLLCSFFWLIILLSVLSPLPTYSSVSSAAYLPPLSVPQGWEQTSSLSVTTQKEVAANRSRLQSNKQ